MRVVLWIGKGANQKALANKMAAHFNVVGIVAESPVAKRKMTLTKVASKVVEKIFLSSIDSAWWNMNKHYDQQYPSLPAVEIATVENINSEAAYRFTQHLQPDLILVSGTRLVKDKMLSLQPRMGIMNLHTGLSPYVKGGPNCTNWCIATAQFHLIGNTIMWIDAGIDTGNIVTTEFTPLAGDETLAALHLKVMEHAHDLYIRAVNAVQQHQQQNIQQHSIAQGTTYYTREWTLHQKIKLVRNMPSFRKAVQSSDWEDKRKSVRTVSC